MYKDIAIIGYSLKLPNADNLEQFHNNLLYKKDCIKSVSLSRRKLLNLDPEKDYLEVGYIEGIELFDNKFFNIPAAEAKYICPEQRLGLEMAAEAIMSSGYSLEYFRGKNCAVLISSTENEYKELAGQDTGSAFTGNLKSLTAGKISYYLDLEGPSITIDASCASSLVGIHEGCMKIISGETNYALVGGISINIIIPEFSDSNFNTLGVVASGGRSRSFDANAQGTGIGEGGGFVLLKLLSEAEKDNDYIYGVIKGSALSGDGSRKGSLTSPSVEGQCQAIVKAWEMANINPEEITDIEAHGTGTLIGDPIEIEALNNGFAKYTKKKQFVYLGALKSSIGHLTAAAGIASLLKVISQYKYNVSYPIVHFEKPNPYIDFSSTALIPLKEVRRWEPRQKRITGISGFGFSGTNAHIIVENYYNQINNNENSNNKWFLKISAKSERAYKEYVTQIINYLKQTDHPLSCVTYVANSGRDDYEYRNAILIKNRGEAISELRNISEECYYVKKKKIAVVLTANTDLMGIDSFKYYVKQFKFITDCVSKIDMILADRYGQLVIDAVIYNKNVQKSDIMQALLSNNNHKLSIPEMVKENTIMIEIGGSEYANLELHNVRILEAKWETIELCVKDLYLNGVQIDWKKLYTGRETKKVPFPVYPFEKQEHWIYPEKINSFTKTEEKKTDLLIESHEKVRAKLVKIWSDILETDEWREEDSFFELGGNSLTGMMLLDEIEDEWNIKFPFEKLYTYETFNKFYELILEKMKDVDNKDEAKGKVEIISIDDRYIPFELNSLQNLIYNSALANTNNSGWNLSVAIEMLGKLDIARMNTAIENAVKKFECFRTIIIDDNKKPLQIVLPAVNTQLKIFDYTKEGYNKAINTIERKANTPINILGKLPYQFELYIIGDESYIFFANIHHIISDGSSLGILLENLNKEYLGVHDSKKIYQQMDFNHWINEFSDSQEGKEQFSYWKESLKNTSIVYEKTATKAEGKNVSLKVNVSTDVIKLSEITKFNVFSILLTAFHIWIAYHNKVKYTYCTTVLANRTKKEFKDACGCLADLAPICLEMNNCTVVELIGKTSRKIKEAVTNQEYPFIQIAANMNGSNHLAFEETAKYFIAFQNYKTRHLKLDEVDLKEIPIMKNGYKTDLSISLVQENEVIRGILEYNDQLYSKEFIKEFIEKYNFILSTMSENPTITIPTILSMI